MLIPSLWRHALTFFTPNVTRLRHLVQLIAQRTRLSQNTEVFVRKFRNASRGVGNSVQISIVYQSGVHEERENVASGRVTVGVNELVKARKVSCNAFLNVFTIHNYSKFGAYLVFVLVGHAET